MTPLQERLRDVVVEVPAIRAFPELAALLVEAADALQRVDNIALVAETDDLWANVRGGDRCERCNRLVAHGEIHRCNVASMLRAALRETT